jgi:integral membrane sensor domain MASE1
MTETRKRSPLQPGSTGWLGASIGIALGLGLFALGASSMFREVPLPPPLVIALCVVGALEAVVSWYTIRRVRVAWAFATAIGSTAAVVFLFSAPKIRDGLEVSLTVALMPALVGAVAATLLALASDEVSSS